MSRTIFTSPSAYDRDLLGQVIDEPEEYPEDEDGEDELAVPDEADETDGEGEAKASPVSIVALEIATRRAAWIAQRRLDGKPLTIEQQESLAEHYLSLRQSVLKELSKLSKRGFAGTAKGDGRCQDCGGLDRPEDCLNSGCLNKW